MTEKDDAIAATSGVDSMIRTTSHVRFSATSALRAALTQFAPELVPQVEMFLSRIEPLDVGPLQLVLKGEATPKDIGVETDLSLGRVKVLIDIEIHEREIKAERDHKEMVASIPVEGEMRNSIIKYLLVALIGFMTGQFV